MPIENDSFEIAGSRPGLASGWRMTASTQRVRVGAFDDPPVGFERFEWGADLGLLLAAPMVVGTFDEQPEAREDFEDGWGGGLFDLSPGISALGITDDLERALLDSWDDVPSAAGVAEVFAVAGYEFSHTFGAGERPADVLDWIHTFEVGTGNWTTEMTTF